MDEATLRGVLKSVISDEKLAKVEDVVKLHDSMEKHETKLTNFEDKFAELERRLERVEGTAASSLPKTATGSTSTGSRARTASSAGDADKWRPRLVHVKGFVEYGCPSSHKVRKGQMEQI